VAWANAALKANPPLRRDKVVWEQAGDKAADQAEAPAGVRAKAEVADRAAAGSRNTLINQRINCTQHHESLELHPQRSVYSARYGSVKIKPKKPNTELSMTLCISDDK
jgi:hypothetical protein